MTQRDWQVFGHTLGVFLNGQEIADLTPRGEPIADDSFLLLFNAHFENVGFTLPARRFGGVWALELSTAEPDLAADDRRWSSRAQVVVTSRSLVLLRRAT
jgi:glycogen operon protein